MGVQLLRLGDFIKQIDDRARDSKKSYSLSDIAGISSITKEFQKTKANLIDVTVDSYKICPPNCFAYNPNTARMGDKIPIALNNTKKDILVSSIYPVFQLDNTKILSEFLLLYFKRSEFDRYARYMSTGSAREIFDWDEMCCVELPVPDIKKQQKIVNNYNAITNRIQIKQKINENLEKAAQCLFDEMFPDIIDNGTNFFGDIIDFSNGKTRPNEVGSIPVYGGNGIMSYTNKTNAENCIAIGRVGAYCGSTYLCKSQCWISDNAIKAKYKFSDKQFFAYYLLKKSNLFERHIGTGQQLLTQGILSSINLTIPNEEKINKFNQLCEPIETNIEVTTDEITKLQELKQFVVSRISGM